jgi:hypothetical protein
MYLSAHVLHFVKAIPGTHSSPYEGRKKCPTLQKHDLESSAKLFYTLLEALGLAQRSKTQIGRRATF